MVAGGGDAGGVDLAEARVGEAGAPLVCTPGRGHVASLGVGREVIDVRVAAGREHDGVAGHRPDLSRDQVAYDDAAGAAVDDDDVQQLGAGVHAHPAVVDLACERRVRAQQQLLTGLAPAIEGALHEYAPERAIGEQTAVLAGEGNALGDGLVDDARAQLGQPVDVGLP